MHKLLRRFRGYALPVGIVALLAWPLISNWSRVERAIGIAAQAGSDVFSLFNLDRSRSRELLTGKIEITISLTEKSPEAVAEAVDIFSANPTPSNWRLVLKKVRDFISDLRDFREAVTAYDAHLLAPDKLNFEYAIGLAHHTAASEVVLKNWPSEDNTSPKAAIDSHKNILQLLREFERDPLQLPGTVSQQVFIKEYRDACTALQIQLLELRDKLARL